MDSIKKFSRGLHKEFIKQRKAPKGVLNTLTDYSVMHKLAKEQRQLGNIGVSKSILQNLYEPVGTPYKHLTTAEKNAKEVLRERTGSTYKSQRDYMAKLNTNESVKNRDISISARLAKERSEKKAAQILDAKRTEAWGGIEAREKGLALKARLERQKQANSNRVSRKSLIGTRRDKILDRAQSVSNNQRKNLERRLAKHGPAGTHPNTGRPIYNTFEERQAARQRDIAAIKEKYKDIPKKPVFKYSPNKAGEIPYSLAHEEKGGLVRNRKLPKNIIDTRRDSLAETKTPKPKPTLKIGKITGKVTSNSPGVANAQSGDRGIEQVKKLGASNFVPITSLHTQMTPNPEVAKGFDGTAYPRPGTRSNIPFLSKHDKKFGKGPVPLYEEARNGADGGRLVGKPPSAVTRDITESTHYDKKQAAIDFNEQAVTRANNPNFKRFDALADERTAAFMGLNTTVGSESKIQQHLDLGGRGKQAIPTSNAVTTAGKNGINQANQVNNPLASTSSRSVLPPIYTNPETDSIRTGVTNPSLEEMSEDFNRTNSAIKPMAAELAGISNLGEADATTYGKYYNQSLVNQRIAGREGFANLPIHDVNSVDKKTGALKQGKLLTNHTTASVLGYGSASLTTGYGMGWGNAWRASRKEHAIRAISTINPLSFGNMSIAGEALGLTSKLDRLRFKANPSAINRFTAAASPLFAGGTIAYGMFDNQDMGEIATNLLIPVAALPAARAGISIGAMVTPAKTAKNLGVVRGIGLAGGAVGGFIAGAGVVMAASGALRDINSNTSTMRSLSKKLATSEVYVPEMNSRQSLTARQMSLNKLARSGLNDRALLLANEAASLKGIL